MDDVTDMERCTTHKVDGKNCEISCNLGLWSVSGLCGFHLINEATHYFEQYKSDGEYSDILGGKSVMELLQERGGNPQEHVISKNENWND